jgi:glycine cleavage system transcriptional repressor
MHQLVITAVGPDHPGLVDQLTQKLGEHRCNIADSRMVNLHGQFAVVMLTEVPDEQVADVRRILPSASASIGLRISVDEAATAPRRRRGVPYRIRTYAMDQAGLVRRFAAVFAAHQANIEDMTTRLEHGPHTGTPLFSMDMVVTIPPEVKLAVVRADLERLCAELNCDLDIDRA